MQELPAVSDAGQVVPADVNSVLKKPKTVSPVIDTAAVPTLVMVTTLVTGARGVGIVNVRTVPPKRPGANVPLVAAVKFRKPLAVPVPVRVTGEPATGTFAVKVAVPLTGPTVVGRKTTLSVQVAPAAKVAPVVVIVAGQEPPPNTGREKADGEKATVMPVPGAVPVLCNVRVWGKVVVKSGTVPKFNGPPVTLRIAPPPPPEPEDDPNSMAPGSNMLTIGSPGPGRRFP